MDITVWTDTESPNNEAGEYYEGVLKELGFNTKLKIINADNYFTVIGNQSTPDLDTGWSDWFEDYPHPNDFFQPLLAGESILQTNNGNFANIDEPALNKEIAKLGEEQLGPEQEAAYAELDEEVHGTGALGPVRDADPRHLRLQRHQPRKHHLQPDVRQYLTSFEFKIGAGARKQDSVAIDPQPEARPGVPASLPAARGSLGDAGPGTSPTSASFATGSRSPSSASSS